MNQTIKDLLKPPFHYHIGSNLIHDSDENTVLVAGNVIFYGDNADRFFAQLVTFLNEKYEKDFTEPMRWTTDKSHPLYNILCPKCGRIYLDPVSRHHLDVFSYCPNCGQKLLPPEEV